MARIDYVEVDIEPTYYGDKSTFSEKTVGYYIKDAEGIYYEILGNFTYNKVGDAGPFQVWAVSGDVKSMLTGEVIGKKNNPALYYGQPLFIYQDSGSVAKAYYELGFYEISNNELITLKQLKEYDKARAANMVGNHTTKGYIDENLIYRACQRTPDYADEAFSGLFYEVADFMESEQIPSGAKLIYSDGEILRFCTSFPPISGLQFGTAEEVAQNKEWFENIRWMDETVALADFEYSTPTIEVKDADGNTRSIATQKVQAFVDYRENATDQELDRRSAQTVIDLLNVLPIGSVLEMVEGYNPNGLLDNKKWILVSEDNN